MEYTGATVCKVFTCFECSLTRFLSWLGASALHFTETVEEFEDSIMQKKMKIPKMSIKYSGNSIENHFEEDRLPLRHKKVSY